MTSSRYATGRVCQVVAGDSMKCTKMASVQEKTVAQGSVVANAKWSLTQVLLYMIQGTCQTNTQGSLKYPWVN